MTGRHRAPVTAQTWADALVVVVIFALPIGSAIGLPLLLGGWLL